MRLRTKIRSFLSDFVRCGSIMGNLIVSNRRNVCNRDDSVLDNEDNMENKDTVNASASFINYSEVVSDRLVNDDSVIHDNLDIPRALGTEIEVKQDDVGVDDNNCFCPLMSLLFYDCKAASAAKSGKNRRKNSDKSTLLESGENLNADNKGFTGMKRRTGNNQTNRNSAGSKNVTLSKVAGRVNENHDVIVYGDEENERNYNNCNTRDNRCTQDENDDESMLLADLFPSFWDLILTLYLPILVQSIFGTFYVARSLLVNYGIPYYIVHVFFMIASKLITSSRLQALMTTLANIQEQSLQNRNELIKVEATSTTGTIPLTSSSTTITSDATTTTAVLGLMTTSNKGSHTVLGRIWNSCNPPSLIAFLAIITVAAMVVHPDGYTWIILRKIRKSTMTVFRLSSDSWAVVVNVYGPVISTLLALGTLVALFLVTYILHRSLKIRSSDLKSGYHSANKNLDKHKRKKRKNGNHGKNNRTRIRNNNDVIDSSNGDHYVQSENSADYQSTPDHIDVMISSDPDELSPGTSKDEEYSINNQEDIATSAVLASATFSEGTQEMIMSDVNHRFLEKEDFNAQPEKLPQKETSADRRMLKFTKSLSKRFAISESSDGTKTHSSDKFLMRSNNTNSYGGKSMKQSDKMMIQNQATGRRPRQRNLSRTGSISTIDTSLTDDRSCDSSDTYSISTPTSTVPAPLKKHGGISTGNRIEGSSEKKAKRNQEIGPSRNESSRNFNATSAPRSAPNQRRPFKNSNKNSRSSAESAETVQNGWAPHAIQTKSENVAKSAKQTEPQPSSSTHSASRRWNALKPLTPSVNRGPNRVSRHQQQDYVGTHVHGSQSLYCGAYPTTIKHDSLETSEASFPEDIQFQVQDSNSSDDTFVQVPSIEASSFQSGVISSIGSSPTSFFSVDTSQQRRSCQCHNTTLNSTGNNSHSFEIAAMSKACNECQRDSYASNRLHHHAASIGYYPGRTDFLDGLISAKNPNTEEEHRLEQQLVTNDNASMHSTSHVGFKSSPNNIRPPPGLGDSAGIAQSTCLNDVSVVALEHDGAVPLGHHLHNMNDIFSCYSTDITMPDLSGDIPDSAKSDVCYDTTYSSSLISPSIGFYDRVTFHGHSDLYRHHNVLKENPFADSDEDVRRIDEEEEEEIFEAELKALGGQMVCSILEF